MSKDQIGVVIEKVRGEQVFLLSVFSFVLFV
ncbi:hypothetical protein FHEFKHOI_01413 [Candidatus Methanoperedenaceae archaeon GB50]|nr:MAG: hypothetical protein KBONHNOK_00309 [Candidatus Methanoperedenaceae archaeon GB50]CAD7773419.1 hypothetical protein AIOGIFDO_01408 [Candidatus Methanoperedenaceae archaeon GB37]CAD7773540.1 hypothetical protein FHEFKHOI_01413 [Candidatus Methanoperedenaceae archaeon GB50]